MKKIYILDEHQSSKRNGIGTFIEELTYCLQQLNMEICLISINSDDKEFNITKKENGIKFINFPPIPKNHINEHVIIEKFIRLYIEDSSENIFILNHFPCDVFLKVIKRHFPQSKFLLIIHDQMWTNSLLGDSKKLYEIISKEKNKDIRNCFSIFIKNFKKDRKAYSIANGVICLSNDTYKVTEEIYKISDNLHIIEHGCRDKCKRSISTQQKQKVRTKLNIDANEKLIIYIGCLCKAKGIEVLLKAFCKIVKENPKTRLIVVGSPAYKEYYNFLFGISKEAASKISFLGQLSRLEIKDWYIAADIGIIPSYTEQCSFTGIEMMMYGLPIVTSDGFGIKNMYTDEINAKIAKIEKNEEEYEKNLIKAINDLLNSQSECRLLSKNARKIFKKKYSIDNMINKYNKLLYSLE